VNAALATVLDISPALVQYEITQTSGVTMTADDKGIVKAATAIGLKKRGIAELDGRRRMFFRAQALAGGGYHAYCAIAPGMRPGTVIAWDPDTDELDCKEVPLALIDPNMIYG
jgi:hypothetical protein